MIITLIAHEKNLGLLALTDHLLEKLGKDNCAVLGSNYLVPDTSTLMSQIAAQTQNNKSVIVKYVVPKQKFSNQDVVYPKELETLSDVVVRVPTFIEELKRPISLEVLKGDTNPIVERVTEYYT